jgi:hypothetical protein
LAFLLFVYFFIQCDMCSVQMASFLSFYNRTSVLHD